MKKKMICLIPVLCAAVFFGIMPPAAMKADASAITQESIREKENQISKAKKEKDSLQGSLTNLQKVKKDLEAQKADLKSYVQQLDAHLAQIDQNIADLQDKIADKVEEISLTEAELKTALEREESQKQSMEISIRLIYEMGNPSLWDLMLKASSFSDFLNRVDYVERVLAYSQRLLSNYEQTRIYVELCKEKLEIEKDILDETKAGVEQEQHNLEELIEQKNHDILAYENDINNKEKLIREYQEEIKAQEEEIRALEAAVAEDKKKLLESQILKYDGGVFKFPLATYTRVSSDYGTRDDPILHIQKFHNGIDFAAPKGTPIYAAYDGKVAAATYNASMGNYVMIDHGDGLYTVYMHASVLYVKKGDVVVKGDTIAGVGTTGRSTGNHLHFSVRLNGEYVSPWSYLGVNNN